MYMNTTRVLGRSLTALAIGATLALSGASLAGASGHRDHGQGGSCASAKVSPFSYKSGGTGGYVSAVSATSVTVAQWNGTTTVFTLTPTTTYSEGKTATTIASLVVGDRVLIQTATGAPTTATAVTIELAELFGKVTTVSGSTISIADFQGFTRTIVVSPTTTYTSGGAPGTFADVTVGSKIVASGTIDANGTSLDALSIVVGTSGSMQSVRGTVTAASTTGLTLQSHGGTTTSFTYTPTTTFMDGKTPLSLANVVVGERVAVEVNSAAATTALSVEIKLTSLSGTVSAVNGSTITIADHKGFTRSVNVTSSTTYTSGGAASSFASVVVGAKICAKGTIATDGSSLNAISVSITAPKPAPAHNGGGNSGWGNGGGNGHGHGHHGFVIRGSHR